MKPSRYGIMARTMMSIIKRARIPPYLHRKSNHMYTVWQHLIFLTLRQYEAKSYRRFVDFLHECVGVQEFLGLSKIPHYTTLQKAAARLTHGILIRILESFVIHARIRKMFAGIDSTGLSHGQTSYYYTKRFKLRRKFVKISVCADMRRQIICSIKIRHRHRHDSVDFVPLLRHTGKLVPIGTVVADRGYDSESNHIQTENLGIPHTVIRPKYETIQVWKTKGFHRKMMKRHFDWDTYRQRSKAETIFSVIKRMLGEHVMSRYILTQNRETMYRMIAYNCYRITRNYSVILDGFYTAPKTKTSMKEAVLAALFLAMCGFVLSVSADSQLPLVYQESESFLDKH
ncbi:IS5 family transposase [Candidatus Nitrosotenuis uzonensis]|uniref:Transposase n=1 Tax=Candidatus Nitrosotenuis uzonensis TaxID=1407055 RepID=A0A812F0T7_9ARCH|nr:IS5 family transposase [Candidatus Nitrosotenuis uzonensis]CAE6486527.1 transposase [Candidatus Nitrosotenuis uzonensis]